MMRNVFFTPNQALMNPTAPYISLYFCSGKLQWLGYIFSALGKIKRTLPGLTQYVILGLNDRSVVTPSYCCKIEGSAPFLMIYNVQTTIKDYLILIDTALLDVPALKGLITCKVIEPKK